MACRKNNALLRPEESELFIRTADSEKGLWAADNSTGMAGFVRSGEKKKPKPQLSGLLDVTGGFSFTVGLAFP